MPFDFLLCSILGSRAGSKRYTALVALLGGVATVITGVHQRWILFVHTLSQQRSHKGARFCFSLGEVSGGTLSSYGAKAQPSKEIVIAGSNASAFLSGSSAPREFLFHCTP